MSLKLSYYGQNDGTTVPDITLTGDPSIDQGALTAAGYISGRLMALKNSATAGRGTVIVPCDADTMVPYGTLINGGGEYATSIGPSGSKKAPIVRAMWQGTVQSDAYDSSTFVVGTYVYCGGTAASNIGLYTQTKSAASGAVGIAAVGICVHKPTTAEPWLGVASLL